MNWGDTFLSNGKLLEMFGKPDFTERQGREAQAEISFLAGRRDVLDLLRKTNVRAWEELLVYIGGGGK